VSVNDRVGKNLFEAKAHRILPSNTSRKADGAWAEQRVA
jgi:hypothetical protein